MEIAGGAANPNRPVRIAQLAFRHVAAGTVLLKQQTLFEIDHSLVSMYAGFPPQGTFIVFYDIPPQSKLTDVTLDAGSSTKAILDHGKHANMLWRTNLAI